MSRYINAERIKLLMKQDRLLQGNCEYQLWKQEVDRQVNAMPYIDLDDYVPKDFHDKTCEAMAERHTEEMQRLMSKRGEWIRTGRTNIYGGIEVQCSNCGDKVMVQHLEDEWYCRHCGADMGTKGADDETTA